ncbi:MAG: acid phosphatase, partial [Burkholderiaceae bacterium]|nr:acid phosphatase [Burkholderiaceae bacterium]
MPLAFACAALLARHTGLDDRIAALAFDPAAHGFPARHWLALELLGHKLAKSALWAVWLTLVAAAVAAGRLARLRPHRA